jgi:hypothetical protein
MGTKAGLFRTRQGYKNCIIISVLVALAGCASTTTNFKFRLLAIDVSRQETTALPEDLECLMKQL